MKPEVAVILPCHNSMPHLAPMLKNLYESTNFPFKLIIIESESTDGTKEFVKLYGKFKNVEVYHTKKKGLTHAINYGIKKAKNLDVYLTQDDVIHFKLYGRDWLLEMNELASKKEVGFVVSLGGWGVSGEEYIKGLKWAGTWNTYIPRSTIKKVGLFDENMSPGDDIDYSYRVQQAKLKGGITNYWVQHHRLTEHGDVDSRKKQREMGEYFRRKHGIK